VLAIGDEIAARVVTTLGDASPGLHDKLVQLDLGVDTSGFLPIERSERAANVERVKALVGALPRGRTAEQQRALRDALLSGDDAAATLAADAAYVAKYPDADVEAKLDLVDWTADSVVAFVGRLIAAKGVHALIAALPLVLEQTPNVRLLIIGHGPLREPLEAMVHALAAGDRELYARVVAHAESIGAGEPEHIEALHHFQAALGADGRTDAYWQLARRLVRAERVLFTGYLTHREMAWLLPCCDAAIFPSMVVEAGPLVFLEALASGVFPIGTYFGGMATKIDRIAPLLDDAAVAAMKVRPDAAYITADIATALPRAVALAGQHRTTLRNAAEEHYDWRPVARRLAGLLEETARNGRRAANGG
jgi:glycosyltransferase involved in cell wall biosynthesis